MGKIHTLKRAVKRNPQKWYATTVQLSTGVYYSIYGAYRDYAGQWTPRCYSKSYARDVLEALIECGEIDADAYATSQKPFRLTAGKRVVLHRLRRNIGR